MLCAVCDDDYDDDICQCRCAESTVERLEVTDSQTEILYRFDGMNLFMIELI